MPGKRKKKLSEKQKRVYDVLKRFQHQNGYSPSLREIRALANLSSISVVDYILDQLEEMGWIARKRGVSRSVRLVNQPSQPTPAVLQIPIVSRIAAGEFLPVPPSDFAIYDYESKIDVLQSQLPARENGRDLYALEVQGDSMIDAMVNDGDIVIMKPAHEARNGEMVAIWRTDENATTLKHFYRENGHVRLQPANPTMEAIIVEDPGILEIHGKVVMIIRQVSGPAS